MIVPFRWPLSPRLRVRDRRPARRPVVFRDDDAAWVVRYRDGQYQNTELWLFGTHAEAIVYAHDVARHGRARANAYLARRNAARPPTLQIMCGRGPCSQQADHPGRCSP